MNDVTRDYISSLDSIDDEILDRVTEAEDALQSLESLLEYQGREAERQTVSSFLEVLHAIVI